MIFRADQCWYPPRGWRCYLAPGHEGPCPAYPVGITRWRVARRLRKIRR